MRDQTSSYARRAAATAASTSATVLCETAASGSAVPGLNVSVSSPRPSTNAPSTNGRERALTPPVAADSGAGAWVQPSLNVLVCVVMGCCSSAERDGVGVGVVAVELRPPLQHQVVEQG